MAKQSISCYQPSGLNSTFTNDIPDFQTYIEKTREMILRGRIDINPQNQDAILSANQPEQYLSNNKRLGILLIHGLFYSPYLMKSLFQHFQQKNILVRSLLLPGHGTVPGDLLDVNYHAWCDATAFAIDAFQQQVDHLIVIGTSTGAITAMHQTLMHKNISGLVLFAPALSIKNPLACLAPILSSPMKWVSKQTEVDYARYLSITTNCVAQVHNLAQQIHALLKKQPIKIPQLFIGSLDDEVVSTPAIIDYFKHYYSDKNYLLLYGNHSVDLPFNNVEIKKSFYPEKNILNFSHSCLTVAPSHPHFGEYGDSHDQHLYHTWYGKWIYKFAYKKPFMRGAASLTNLYHYNLERLSFNPDFDNMMQKIDAFIEEILLV